MGVDLSPRRLAPGLEVHPLGVGCRSVGASSRRTPVPDSEWLNGFRTAVAHGANLFDTADTYGHGHAERLLGRVVRECRQQGITLKISSKVGHRGSAPHPYAGPHLRHQLEQSLDNLAVEGVDLYVLPSHDFGANDRYLGTTIEVMRTMRQLGMIGAIGLAGPRAASRCSDPIEEMARFKQLFGLIRPDVVLLEFNALTPLAMVPDKDDQDFLSYAEAHGVGVLLTSPLAGGLLANGGETEGLLGPARRDSRAAMVAAALAPLRRRLGGHPGVLGQAALRYCLTRGRHTAVVAGFGKAEHVASNYAGLGLALTERDEEDIVSTYSALRAHLRAASARGAGRQAVLR